MNLSDIWGAHDEEDPGGYKPVYVGDHSMEGLYLMIRETNDWISGTAMNSAMDERDVCEVLNMAREYWTAIRCGDAAWFYETNMRSNKLIEIRDKVRSEIERVEKINANARRIVSGVGRRSL